MSPSVLVVRRAAEAELDELAAMIDDFVRGHPAEHHPRPREALRAALFGDDPVARVFVAIKHGRIVGMGQWWRIFDLFWSMHGGKVEWLYVRPEARGLGIAAAIIAAICDDVRRAGGEFLHGGSDGERVSRLYERVAIGAPTRECFLSAEAFQVFADLAGRSPREIVRGLPAPEQNRVPAQPRP
jgi:GNAT superfamily N-acetyltransferase